MGEPLLSGEMRCTMTALTSLLAANDQYEAKDVEGAAQDEDGNIWLPRSWRITAPVKPDKKMVQPLLYGPHKQVVISGTALKGMLRHSLGALLAAPMERVGERSYSYRPNLEFTRQTNGLLREARAAIVQSFNTATKSLDVLVLPSSALQNTIFVRTAAYEFLPIKVAGELQRAAVPGVSISATGRRRLFVTPGAAAPLANYRYYPYAGGVDGVGKLGAKFTPPTETYSHVLVDGDDRKRAELITVSADVLKQFDRTIDHLKDEMHGHLRNDHPLLNKLIGNELQQVKDGIEACRSKVRTAETLIYVELEHRPGKPDKIVSLGHNYRYRWRYNDTVRTKGGVQREVLRPLREELSNPPQKLSGVRLLFGYVSDDKNDGVKGVGGGAVPQLSGRIAFNMALEVLTGNGALETRFLNANCAFVTPLKILGQPKPSAIEEYLAQPGATARRILRGDAGLYVSYGDTPGEKGGDLAGRKFYPHRPAAATDPRLYTADDEDNDKETLSGNQSALARYVSKPGAQFRFTLRFRDLRSWELGAILVALEPSKLAGALPPGQPANPQYALKLGHGRPLGLGSVRINVDATEIFDDDYRLTEGSSEGNAAVKAFNERAKALPDSIKKAWCDVHLFGGERKVATILRITEKK